MRISHSSYSSYIKKLSSDLSGAKLYSPLLLNNKTLVFPIMERQKEILVISLNPKCPLLFKTKNDLFFSSFENSFLAKYRKYYGKVEIKGITLKEDDLVVELDLHSIDEYEDFSLIVELIPNSPNLLIVQDDILKDHYFSSKERKLENGKEYMPLTNKKLFDGDIQINDELFKSILDEEYKVRLKEKYADFLKYINSKIKGAKRKIKAIENDVEIAGKNLIFQEIADNIFALGLDLKSHQKSIVYEGNLIELDEAKTLIENVQQFYKKSKKAKETIERSKINIENAKKEADEYSKILDEFSNGDELKKDELMSLYTNSKKKKETRPTVLNRPWKINLNGTIIYFGRNASQNDYLSFAMKLDREFTWLHIKDKSGAHLVIANVKPTENELLTASEIALLCSRAIAGEVSYTKKKNVRRGHVLGEALLKNYSVIKINTIRKETITLFESAVRCD